jgi:hypothetical protein
VIERTQEQYGKALTEADLQAAGGKEKAVIPEGEDREIRAKPLPAEDQPGSLHFEMSRLKVTQADNPPRKIPDLFQFS